VCFYKRDNYIIIIIMALQPFVGPWPLFQFLDPIHGRTPWTGDQPVASHLLAHRTTQNKRTKYRRSCLEWDSNPRSQRSSERTHFML
jgi:hypothetical protein